MTKTNLLIENGCESNLTLLILWPELDKQALTDSECLWVWKNTSRNSPEGAEAWKILLSRAKTFDQCVTLWGIASPNDDLDGDTCWNLSSGMSSERTAVWQSFIALKKTFEQSQFLWRIAANCSSKQDEIWRGIDPKKARTSVQRRVYWCDMIPEDAASERDEELQKLRAKKKKVFKDWQTIWEMFDEKTMGSEEAWEEMKKQATTFEQWTWLWENASNLWKKQKILPMLRSKMREIVSSQEQE